MALLTVFCGNCVHVELEDQQALVKGGLTCQACGSALRLVPGCSFSEADRELFHDVRQVVTERTVSPAEAKVVAADIAGVLSSGADHTILERLTARFPGLLPLQIAAGQSRPAGRRALKVLRAILEAKALGQ